MMRQFTFSVPLSLLWIAVLLGMANASGAGRDVQSGPEELVREYVERDARGERLRTAPWFLEVVTWLDEPAFDSYTVVGGFIFEPVLTTTDTARIEVTYHRLGWIETRGPNSQRFVEDVEEEQREFVVVRRHGTWLIAAPRLDPRVLVDSVLTKAPLNRQDAERLRFLASKREARRRADAS